MGESIAEGTIVRWIKKLGEPVDRDEPLFEISTDKVDAEIPSPAAGVLTDIRVKEGETVPVNSVVAVIGGGDAPAVASGRVESAAPAGNSTAIPQAAVGQPEASAPAEQEHDDEEENGKADDDDRRLRSSPLVRRIAKEHNVDIRLIKGTGVSGRVTKQDILGFIESGGSTASSQAGRAARRGAPEPAPGPVVRPGESVPVGTMSVLRR